MKSSLAENFEVWGFEQDCLVFKDFSLGQMLRIEPVDISCATDEEINALHDRTCDFLNGLPAGLSLQFVQHVRGGVSETLERHRALECEGASPLSRTLVDKRAHLLLAEDEAGRAPQRRFTLAVRRTMRRKDAKRRVRWPWQSSESEPLTETELAQEAKELKTSIAAITDGLAALGVDARALSEDEAFAEIFDQWNPGHPVEGLNFNREDMRDDLALNDVVASARGFALGRVHHRLITLKSIPEFTFAGMAEKLSDLPFDSRLFASIETLDQDRETFALETQRRIAYAMFAGKRGVSDLEAEAKLKDIESLLALRVAGKEKIFSASLSIVLRSHSETEVDEMAARTLQLVRELSGAEGLLESYAATHQFVELSLPNARSAERARRINTSVLADFLPIFGDWPGHDEPRILLRNRSGGLVAFDPFSPRLTNFNQVVSGGSGAGKSFLTNVLIAQLMKEDPKVFILDIGGSYRKMTENLGGQYVALGESGELSLNPFDLEDKAPEAVDQKIKFLSSLVEIMSREDGDAGIGKLERAEVERMIAETIASESVPRLSRLRERLLVSDEAPVRRIGKILGPWCGDSPYGKFVDRDTNLSLSKRIVCFDLKALESHPDLQAACLFIVTDLIWRETQRDRTSMKIVVFDECWKLIASDAGARFIGEVFRTFRKYRASAIAISQTMDDFAKSKAADAILPNASCKWVLKQAGANLATVCEALSLNERETKLIASVTSKKGVYSEAFLAAGDDRQVVRIESTPLEYWLATTDPQDLKVYAEEKAARSDLNDVELLEGLSDRLPRGASGGLR